MLVGTPTSSSKSADLRTEAIADVLQHRPIPRTPSAGCSSSTCRSMAIRSRSTLQAPAPAPACRGVSTSGRASSAAALGHTHAYGGAALQPEGWSTIGVTSVGATPVERRAATEGRGHPSGGVVSIGNHHGRRRIGTLTEMVASARSTPVGRAIAPAGRSSANPCAQAAAVSRTPTISGPATVVYPGSTDVRLELADGGRNGRRLG